MAKKLQTFSDKTSLRNKIQNDIEAFLEKGGAIEEVPTGYTEISVLDKKKLTHLKLNGK